MRPFIKLFLLGFIILLFVLPAFASEPPPDLRLRNGISLRKKLNNRIDLRLNMEYRLFQNLSRAQQVLFEPEIQWKFASDWDLSAVYRYSQSNRGNRFLPEHRITLALSREWQLTDWSFSYRLGSQTELPDYFYEELSTNVNWPQEFVLRNRVQATYRIFGSRWTPEAGFEWFTKADHQTWKNHQYRIVGKWSYLISLAASVRFFYFFEHEFNRRNAIDSHVLGIEFHYRFR